MNAPKIGGLFAGYGGLEMGVQSVLGGELAWYSEIDKGALKILTHRHPDVPNVGDISTVDWSQVEPVDILTGGSPCQDLSHAGKRAGMTDGTRSNLWGAMREAIAQLRPSLVVWENVRGAYSACADSELGRCPRCVDSSHPGGHAPLLRALGRVLGDLSDLGYDAGWHGLRAADVGAPHGRMRVFVVAYPRDGAEHGEWSRAESWQRGAAAADADGWLDVPSRSRSDQRAVPHGYGDSLAATLLPTPSCSDTNGAGAHGAGGLDLRTAVHLLPTPAVNDMGAAYTPETWDAWTDRMKAEHGNGNGNGKSLSIEAQRLTTPIGSEDGSGRDSGRTSAVGGDLDGDVSRLLPTPESSDGTGGRQSTEFGGFRASGAKRAVTLATAIDHRWGDYADAIARWEHTTGRPAPAPTMTSTKGNPQLAPAFVEWMMGLPAGWVTDTPGITRNEALKALGNGVVPQQAEAALRVLLPALSVAA